MKDRFVAAFDEILAANMSGEVRNLLITDDSAEFLDDALYALRFWSVKNHINLVEIDERDGSWLHEIQSRELFNKLNEPNTVFLIKNYATVNFHSVDENTPRNFLWDAVVNRHYGCGNDFEPSDELDNLLFVVAINDRSLMHWFENEYSHFTVIHDDNKAFYIDTSRERCSSKLCPVLSKFNRLICFASEDCKILSIDAGNAFGRVREIRYCSSERRTDMIHAYINKCSLGFNSKVEHLVVKIDRFEEYEHFIIDATRLRESFPNLKSIDRSPVIEVSNVDESIEIYDPFELGEHAFSIARNGDFETANFLTRRLWELDHKLAKFFREVAVDYQVPREHHERCYPDGNTSNTGLDKLFRIYLLGWCTLTDKSDGEKKRLFLEEYQNINKAVELVKVRFKNWERHEIKEKLLVDLEHIEISKKWNENLQEEKEWYAEDYIEEREESLKLGNSGFMMAVIATDKRYPGLIDEMYSDERFFHFFNDTVN